MKNSAIKTLLILLLAIYAYSTFSNYTPPKQTAREIKRETNPYKFPLWAAFLILSGTAYTLHVIYQSNSRRKRDREFIRILEETPGKIQKTMVFREDGKSDVGVIKGNKIFMTMDTNEEKDKEKK